MSRLLPPDCVIELAAAVRELVDGPLHEDRVEPPGGLVTVMIELPSELVERLRAASAAIDMRYQLGHEAPAAAPVEPVRPINAGPSGRGCMVEASFKDSSPMDYTYNLTPEEARRRVAEHEKRSVVSYVCAKDADGEVFADGIGALTPEEKAEQELQRGAVPCASCGVPAGSAVTWGMPGRIQTVCSVAPAQGPKPWTWEVRDKYGLAASGRADKREEGIEAARWVASGEGEQPKPSRGGR